MITWKRSIESHVESHCGQYTITPLYWSCDTPQAYDLNYKAPGVSNYVKIALSCDTQKEAKIRANEYEHKLAVKEASS